MVLDCCRSGSDNSSRDGKFSCTPQRIEYTACRMLCTDYLSFYERKKSKKTVISGSFWF